MLREIEELATARRHIERCRALVRRQVAIVRVCRQRHSDERDSLTLLRELRVALAIGRHHAHIVERELSQRRSGFL